MMGTVEVYREAKIALGSSLGVTEDVLHIHAGLLIFFMAALLFRRRMRSFVPITLVYLFALTNELVDAVGGGSATRWEPAFDVANTIFWPTLLFLLARRRGVADHPEKTAAFGNGATTPAAPARSGAG